MCPSDGKKKQERLDQAIREGIKSGFTKFNSVEELMDNLNSDDEDLGLEQELAEDEDDEP